MSFPRAYSVLTVVCLALPTGIAAYKFRRAPTVIGTAPVVGVRLPSEVNPASAGHLVGTGTGAGGTIVEWSDFQCPFCGAFEQTLTTLRQERPNVRIVYRQLPLVGLHRYAFAAAIASECAADQGRFTEMHDELFRDQSRIGRTPWNTLALHAGVADTAAFDQCRQGVAAAERVMQDLRTARMLGLHTTPSVVVNGTLYQGILTGTQLQSALGPDSR